MKRLLTIRLPFFRFWLADFLGSFGTGLRFATFPLLAASITSSPLAVAGTVSLQGLPWLVAGPAAGVFVDRRDLRWAVVLSNTVQLVVLGGLIALVFAGNLDLPALYGASFVAGLTATVRVTAMQSAVPGMVEQDYLEQANSQLASGELIGSELLGPASAGWLFGLSAALPLTVNGGATALAIVLLTTLVGRSGSSKTGGPADGAPPTTAFGDFREGFRWLRSNVFVRGLIVTAAVLSLVDAAWFAVLVLYVSRVLHGRPGIYGLLLTAGAVGGISLSAACPALSRRMGQRRLLRTAILAMAISQLILGVASSLVVAAFMLALSSGAFAIFNVLAATTRQREIPRALLGRINAAYYSIALGAESLGAILGGVLAQFAGVRAPLVVGVVPLLGVFWLVEIYWPQQPPSLPRRPAADSDAETVR